MSKRVTLIGATCWGNRGAEAMLMTTIGVIRQRHPDTCFHVMSYYPGKDRELVRDPAVTILDARPAALVLQHFPFALGDRLLRYLKLRWPRSLMPASARALGASELLIDLGGISFADRRAIFLPFNILCILPAMLFGVRVIKLSQALGPFRNWCNRWSARLFLTRCTYVVARGPRTLRHLRELDMPLGRCGQAADVAFGYQPEFSLSRENEDRVKAIRGFLASARSRGVRLIGLSPSTVVRKLFAECGRDYVAFMAELVLEMVRQGYELLVVPNATRQGSSKAKNNDLVVINELRARLEQNSSPAISGKVTWVDFDLNTRDIRDLVKITDVLVTSRFHAMIAALTTCTPVLVVGWSHKYGEVLQAFGLERYAADHTASLQEMSSLLSELLDQADQIRERIAEALPGVRRSALGQFDLIDKVLT